MDYNLLYVNYMYEILILFFVCLCAGNFLYHVVVSNVEIYVTSAFCY